MTLLFERKLNQGEENEMHFGLEYDRYDYEYLVNLADRERYFTKDEVAEINQWIKANRYIITQEIKKKIHEYSIASAELGW